MHYSFKMPGGYVYTRDSHGHADLWPAVNTATAQLLDYIYTGGKPTMSSAAENQIRNEMKHWHVQTVLCRASAPNAPVAITNLSMILMSKPKYLGGVYYWRNLRF
jgi:hypothetical protein